jgi:hypothetical protein
MWIFFAHNIFWGECFPKQLSDADEQFHLPLEVNDFAIFPVLLNKLRYFLL